MKTRFNRPIILGSLLLGCVVFSLYTFTDMLLSLPRRQYLFIIVIVSFIFGFLTRGLLKAFSVGSSISYGKNITTSGRWIRLVSGVILLFLAISTSWSPFLLFFAGFCFFEALFSRCGLNAALGKNSCPV